jgi:hypothetical protein
MADAAFQGLMNKLIEAAFVVIEGYAIEMAMGVHQHGCRS